MTATRQRAASGRIEPGVAAALLIALALGLSWRVPTYGLSGWDTDRYYTENPLLQLPLSACLSEAWTEPFVQAYHPLHLSLICVQGALSSDPAVWMGFSVALFPLAAVALLLMFRAHVGSWVAATLGAGLVVAHPAMVESYASLASQKDLLALIFVGIFLALIPLPPTPRRVVAMGALLVAAAFSKSGYAVPLGAAPLAHAVLVDPSWRAGGLRGLLRDPRIRAGAGLAGLGLALTAIAISVVVATELPKKAVAWMDPATVLGTVAFYAAVVFGGGSPPPVPCLDTSTASVTAGVVAALLHGAGITAALRFGRPIAAYGLVLGAAGLLPYLNLIPTPTLVSGRWLLVLLIGSALAAVDVFRARWGQVLLTVLLVACVAGSLQAQRPWSSRVSLWRDNVARNQCSIEPHANLATAHSLEGRWDDAEAALVAGLAFAPESAKLYRDWALLILLTGGCQPALPPLEAKRLYDEMATGRFTAADARARGFHDVARILVLREGLAGDGGLNRQAVAGGRVCRVDRYRRITSLLPPASAD